MKKKLLLILLFLNICIRVESKIKELEEIEKCPAEELLLYDEKNPDDLIINQKFPKDTNINKNIDKTNEELQNIVLDRKSDKEEAIDTINFIQPSIELSDEQKDKVDIMLTKFEQEQLLILWRATLERNKTIRFIVQKLAPVSDDQKKAQILSQILNTAVFLPFYALQSVAPADTSALASYLSAGVAGDLINGISTKNKDKLALSQTEMVIMFMMIDEIAERVRTEYHEYKSEKADLILARNELEEVRKEASASLELNSPQSQFLSQIRIRQIEREIKRIETRLRSKRVALIDLSGNEALASVDKLIEQELVTLIKLPPL